MVEQGEAEAAAWVLKENPELANDQESAIELIVPSSFTNRKTRQTYCRPRSGSTCGPAEALAIAKSGISPQGADEEVTKQSSILFAE